VRLPSRRVAKCRISICIYPLEIARSRGIFRRPPFSKPTLVLTGRQDIDVGYRDAWRLVECYPRATFVALDRADHGLPIDETDLFEALVLNWLQRVEEWRRFSNK